MTVVETSRMSVFVEQLEDLSSKTCALIEKTPQAERSYLMKQSKRIMEVWERCESASGELLSEENQALAELFRQTALKVNIVRIISNPMCKTIVNIDSIYLGNKENLSRARTLIHVLRLLPELIEMHSLSLSVKAKAAIQHLHDRAEISAVVFGI